MNSSICNICGCRWLKVCATSIVAVFMFGITALMLVPPISRDALIHHLAIPKLYLLHGGIYEIPGIVFSYYPMNLELLYMIPLAFGNDIIPKFIHFAFALFTAWLIYTYIKKRINSCYGLLGAFFFLTIPVIINLSITAYVDLGLIFFSTSSLLLLFQWVEKDYPVRTLFFAGILSGLAVGTKYNGLVSLLIITCFVPLLYTRTRQNSAGTTLAALKYGFLFVFAAFLACSPWLVRNYLWTGNPLFPLLNSLFNPSQVIDSSSTAISIGIFKYRELVYHESVIQMLLLPVRVFLEGQDNVPRLFDGRLNPFLLILPLLAFLPGRVHKKEKIERTFLAIYSVLFLLFALFTTVLRIRYIGPIIPPLAILSMFGLCNFYDILNKNLTRVKIVVVCMLAMSAAMFLPNFQYMYQKFQEIRPFEYISGKLDRDAYLSRHRPEYATMAYANQHLPDSARILCIYMAGRSYYLDRPLVFAPRYSKTFFTLMQEQPLPAALAYLQREKINYLLIRDDLLMNQINNIKEDTERERWHAFFRTHTERLYSSKGYSLFAIKKGKGVSALFE